MPREPVLLIEHPGTAREERDLWPRPVCAGAQGRERTRTASYPTFGADDTGICQRRCPDAVCVAEYTVHIRRAGSRIYQLPGARTHGRRVAIDGEKPSHPDRLCVKARGCISQNHGNRLFWPPILCRRPPEIEPKRGEVPAQERNTETVMRLLPLTVDGVLWVVTVARELWVRWFRLQYYRCGRPRKLV
jgi:hypothetical protein